MSTFLDPSARCEAEELGAGSRVLAHARVGPEVVIGERCLVGDHAVLTGKVALGEEVEILTGAHLIGLVEVEDRASVGAGAVIGHGTSSASGRSEPEERRVVIRRFASIGANATVLPGVEIGRRSVVEPGSVVTENVPANAIVSGNPARIVAYVDGGNEAGETQVVVRAPVEANTVVDTRVQGVTLHALTHARDLRGSLAVAELADLPFAPERIFVVYHVPSESVRGAHAHRTCAQFLICLAGSLSCLVDDGTAREEIQLDRRDVGLHIPPMVWGTQWNYTSDAVLLVLASHPYDASDYIRDYEEFLAVLAGG